MEHDGDGDNSCSWCARNDPEKRIIIKNLWNMMVTVITVVVGALGMIPRR